MMVSSITPHQLDLLRIVATVAWSDGYLAPAEMDLILNRFGQLFAIDDLQQLQQELEDYLEQEIPLEALVSKLVASAEEWELVRQLSYEVIGAAHILDEPLINTVEAAAYERLVQLINSPPQVDVNEALIIVDSD